MTMNNTNNVDISKAKAILCKLLALAASPNEHEATQAMAKAKEIMERHGLSTLDVAQDGSGATIGKMLFEGSTKTISHWELGLASAVGKAFDCRVIGGKAGREAHYRMTVIGGVSDLEIVKDLYGRLNATCKRMMKQYASECRKRHGYMPAGASNGYRVGLVSTIRERLAAMKENLTPTHEATMAGCMDLMVVKGKAVEQRVQREFPRIKTVSGKGRVNRDSIAQGKRDGHNVSLHRSVGGNQGKAEAIA